MSVAIKTFTNIILDPLLINFLNFKYILYLDIQFENYFIQHKLNHFSYVAFILILLLNKLLNLKVFFWHLLVR